MKRLALAAALGLAGCAGADAGSTGGDPDVHANPVLVTLEVSPAEIEPGGLATLDWTARNALTVTLTQNGADLPLGTSSVSSGSMVVSPAGRTEYVITGHGAAGRTATAHANLLVRVVAEGEGAAPQIKEFTASPGTLDRDDEVLLSWNVTDADNVRLTADEETVELADPTSGVGTTRHVPGTTTTYRLTAINAHGESAAEAHVTVPLAILEAEVAPAAVAPGGDARVSYRVQAAESVVLTTDRPGEAPIQGEIDSDGRGEFTVPAVVGHTALTLTAAAGDASVLWEGEVGINVPEIAEFTASPDGPGIDDDVELTWRIDGADTVEIRAIGRDGGARVVAVAGQSPAQGSIEDRPADTTTYELVATGRQGDSRAEATVTVPVAVLELALVGSPAVLGGDVDAAYRVQGADEVTVRFGDGDAVPGRIDGAGRGSVEIEAVRAAGRVTVTASRGDVSDSRAAEISLAPPAIVTFDASAAVAGADAPVRLSWDVLGAERLTLAAQPRVGPPVEIDIAGEGVRRGGVSVSPFLATEYTLTAFNAAGQVAEQVAVDVQPNILRFEATPSPVPYGGDATVHFRVHGVTTVQIDGEGVAFDGEGRGTHPLVGVVAPRTVRLTAIGPDDSTGLDLEVRPAVPRVVRFDVAPAEVGIDEEVQISWQIEGATDLALRADPAVGEPYEVELGEPPPQQGGITLTPAHSTRFTLTASNPEGDSQRAANVTVPLQILELELRGSPAVLGDSVELRTRVQGAVLVEVTLAEGPAQPLALDGQGRGSLTIEDLRRDVAIRLEAFDTEGGVTARDLTAQLRQPVIGSLTADPVQGGADLDVRLLWEVEGAAELALTATPEGGQSREIGLPQGLPGEVTVRPSLSTEYELTARNAAGEQRARLGVNVPLAFLEFEVTGSPVVPGGTVVVRYRVQGAAGVQVAIDDGVPSSQGLGAGGRGEFEAADVQAAFHLTVIATDGGGRQVVREADITLAGPSIERFAADPGQVHPGEGTTLSWSTLRADRVRVEELDGAGAVAGSTEYAGDDAAAGSHDTGGVVTATTYRLVAVGAADLEEEAEITLSVVRDPTALRLSELFYDAEGTDGGHEWIELRNGGVHPMNLADVVIGYGGGGFSADIEPLPELVVAPGGCVVVGGPAVDERSAATGYDVELDFSPDLQNSGVAADGVALFSAVDGPVDAQSVPFDTVLYGPEIDPGHSFIGPDGQPRLAPDVHDVGPGSSLMRDADGVWFEAEIPPTPGRCFGLARQDFTDGDNQVYLGRRRGSVFGGDLVGLRTFGFSNAADSAEVSLGDNEATCFDDPLGIFCLTPAGAGVVDLTLTGPGGEVIYPAFYSYERIALCSIAGYDRDELQPGAAYVGTVTVRTPAAFAPEDLTVHSGWGPPDTDPSLTPDLWGWTPIPHTARDEDGIDTFEGPQDAPDAPGAYLRTFRAAPTDDVFTYCADSPLVYSPELLARFTVIEPVEQ